ncbi:hypothetical protein TWF569_005547 [Orbilia oligospora]|nr:hypothetical protein TWF569_005547 [Orbilia oligospora]
MRRFTNEKKVRGERPMSKSILIGLARVLSPQPRRVAEYKGDYPTCAARSRLNWAGFAGLVKLFSRLAFDGDNLEDAFKFGCL